MIYSSNASKGYQISIEITDVLNSDSGNQSKIQYVCKFTCSNAHFSGKWKCYVQINDKSSYIVNETKASPFTKNNQTVTVASGSMMIEHDSVGAKDLFVHFGYIPEKYTAEMPDKMIAEGTLSLHRIKRCSSFTLTNSLIVGNTYPLDIVPLDSTVSHSLDIWIGKGKLQNLQFPLIENVNPGVKRVEFTVPDTLLQYMENVKQRAATVRFMTWKEDSKGQWVQIGYTDQEVTLSVTGNPTISKVQIKDSNAYYQRLGYFIQNLSIPQFEITAKGSATDSKIVEWTVTIDGKKYTSTNTNIVTVPTGLVSKTGTFSGTATVKDNRGLVSAPVSFSYKVSDFNKSSISVIAEMCNQNGVKNDQGQYIIVTGGGTTLGLDGACNINIYYKEKGTTEFLLGKKITGITGTFKLGEVIPKEGGLDPKKIYQVKLELTDGSRKTDFFTWTKSQFTLLSFGANHKSVAIGKTSSNEDKKFEVALNTDFAEDIQILKNADVAKDLSVGGTLTIKGKLDNQGTGNVLGDVEAINFLKKIYPVGSIYMNTHPTNPSDLFGFGTWIPIQGKLIVGVGQYYTGNEDMGIDPIYIEAGNSYGTPTHLLNYAEMPPHSHNFNDGTRTWAIGSGGDYHMTSPVPLLRYTLQNYNLTHTSETNWIGTQGWEGAADSDGIRTSDTDRYTAVAGGVSSYMGQQTKPFSLLPSSFGAYIWLRTQ